MQPASQLVSTKNLCPGTDLTGSEHNDEFYMDDAGNVRTRTNRSGGVQVFILKPCCFSVYCSFFSNIYNSTKLVAYICFWYVHAGRYIKW